MSPNPKQVITQPKEMDALNQAKPMLNLIEVIIEKAKELQEIQLSMSSFYQLLTELPELPEATGVIVVQGVPIVMKTQLRQRRILVILKTKTP